MYIFLIYTHTHVYLHIHFRELCLILQRELQIITLKSCGNNCISLNHFYKQVNVQRIGFMKRRNVCFI